MRINLILFFLAVTCFSCTTPLLNPQIHSDFFRETADCLAPDSCFGLRSTPEGPMTLQCNGASCVITDTYDKGGTTISCGGDSRCIQKMTEALEKSRKIWNSLKQTDYQCRSGEAEPAKDSPIETATPSRLLLLRIKNSEVFQADQLTGDGYFKRHLDPKAEGYETVSGNYDRCLSLLLNENKVDLQNFGFGFDEEGILAECYGVGGIYSSEGVFVHHQCRRVNH